MFRNYHHTDDSESRVYRGTIMNYSKLLFCILILVPVLSGAEKKLSDNSSFLLSKRKAGHIEIEMTIDALYIRYNRDSTKLVDLYLEGTFSPALEIYIKGARAENKPSLVAEIGWQNDWIVSRIKVYDERFKTDKGIGIGLTLGDMRKFYTVDWIAFGEGGLVARVEAIGISFMLDIEKIPGEWSKTRDQQLIPDSAKIVSALIT